MKKTEWFSLILTTISIGVGIISFFKSNNVDWVPTVTGLLIAELLVLVVWGLYVRDKIKTEKSIENLNSSIEQYKSEQSRLEQEIKESQQNCVDEKKKVLQEIGSISESLKKVSKLNGVFCDMVTELATRSYNTLAIADSLPPDKTEEMELALRMSMDEYKKGLFDNFKRYNGNFFKEVKIIIEKYLEIKGCYRRTSICLKLFSKPYMVGVDNRNDIVVYTAFRDATTYGEGKREIGENKYTIDGNSFFIHCIRNEQCIINNVEKHKGSYCNENREYPEFYNCSITVPIKNSMDNSDKFFGFLCCDCLNKTPEDIYDMQSAQLLFSLAQQLATYLETIESNWSDRVKDAKGVDSSFLDLIYHETCKGKRI